jgi:hypothetical protein
MLSKKSGLAVSIAGCALVAAPLLFVVGIAYCGGGGGEEKEKREGVFFERPIWWCLLKTGLTNGRIQILFKMAWARLVDTSNI